MSRFFLGLGRFVRPERPAILLLFALLTLEAGVTLLKPWPLKLIIDNLLAARPFPAGLSWIERLPGAAGGTGLLAWLVAATVLLFVAGHGLHIYQAYAQAGAGARMTYRLGGALFDRLQRLSLRYHGRRRAGDLVRRVTTDAYCIKDLVMDVQIPLAGSLVSLTAMFVVMWQLDRTLTLVAIGTAPLLVLWMRRFQGPMIERSYKHQQSEGELMALAEQTLTALPAVQAFGREEHEDERFRGLSLRTLRAYLHSLTAQLGFKAGVNLLTAAGMAAVFAVGGLHVLDGTLQVGSLIIFLAYLAAIQTPLETLAYITSGYAGAAAKARRVREVLEAEEEVRDAPDAEPLPGAGGRSERGHVRLEEVTFGYEPGRPVLQGVNLEARPGETVAIVGATGAGKSTLVSLVPRFFDPWAGRVTLDGVDARRIRLASLRSQVAMLFQDPYLLPVSVAENIAYGRPEAAREEVEAAARAANADEFIRRLERGYDTVIGERGATLSGGERQRLAIARALLKDAPVLILDEPTSALDAQTEALLLEALERLMAGRTTIIIAHRFSTIRGADRIAVLEAGRVVESGTHAELMAACGVYHSLHRLQQQGAAPRGVEV